MGNKEFDLKVKRKKSSQGQSLLWSLPLWKGLDSYSVMVCWMWRLVSVFWFMELDLISLKGSSAYNNRFWGVYEFSMTLDSPLGFGSVS